MHQKNEEKSSSTKWYQNPWIKRIGVAGFIFFLVKGLLWLALIFGLFDWLSK